MLQALSNTNIQGDSKANLDKEDIENNVQR